MLRASRELPLPKHVLWSLPQLGARADGSAIVRSNLSRTRISFADGQRIRSFCNSVIHRSEPFNAQSASGDQYTVEKPAGSDNRTFAQLLQATSQQLSKECFAAIPQRRGEPLPDFAYSLSDDCPPNADRVTYLTMSSDHPGARHAIWLLSSYLLGYSLTKGMSSETFKGKEILLGGMPKLLDRGTSGGRGFAYDFLVLSSEALEVIQAMPRPSNYEEALRRVDSLLSMQGVERPLLTRSDFTALEDGVLKLIEAKPKLTLEYLSREEALETFRFNPMKLEQVLCTDATEFRIVRLSSSKYGSDFCDLVPEDAPVHLLPAHIEAFRITNWSAVSFVPSRTDLVVEKSNKSQILSSLRAVAHTDKIALDKLLADDQKQIEASHQIIGKAQSLFLTHTSSPGSPFLLPHGVRVAKKMERVARDLYDVAGYDEVITPQIYKKELWEQSGHWQNYSDDMFAVEGIHQQSQREALLIESITQERSCGCPSHGEGNDPTPSSAPFGLKPMNCPGHCIIFASQPRHAHDLPLRLNEWSPLHRNEPSGSLAGLTRVRKFHQDDGHVFCTPDQVKGEIADMLQMLRSAYQLFGFPSFELALSTRPAKFLGAVEDWDKAEDALREALAAVGMNWTLNPADGAFYGPKIDIRLIDGLGRKHQTATIQLDFQLPQRFDLEYVGPTGETSRPVMIHRAIMGSVERFMAILIESKVGNLPFWLSPRQACVIPATADQQKYAETVARSLSLSDALQGSIDAQGIATEATYSQKAPRTLQKIHVDVLPATSHTEAVNPASNATKTRPAGSISLSSRLKRSQMAKYNFSIIVGAEEERQGTVEVRMRGILAEMKAADPEWWSRACRAQLDQFLEAVAFKQKSTTSARSGKSSSQASKEGSSQPRASNSTAFTISQLRTTFERMDSWHL